MYKKNQQKNKKKTCGLGIEPRAEIHRESRNDRHATRPQQRSPSMKLPGEKLSVLQFVFILLHLISLTLC